MLVLSRHAGEQIKIGDNIVITICSIGQGVAVSASTPLPTS